MMMTDYRTDRSTNTVTHTEEASFPALRVIDLQREAMSVKEGYKNFVVNEVNNHCIRLAVMQGEFRWHHHPRSDECFLVIEGELEIDLADGRTFRLKAGQAFTIPAGIVHQTRSRSRAVNLCFETRDAYTDVVFEDSPTRGS
jgi:mannose-6-phosphate isomerase-like protein (cupin superfamily)